MSTLRQSPHSGQGEREQTLIGFIIDEFGGIMFLIESLERILKYVARFSKNRKWYKFMNLFKMLVPSILIGHRVHHAYKKYRLTKTQKYASDRKIISIGRLMGYSEKEVYKKIDYMDYAHFQLGKEVFNWLLTRPTTTDVKIVGIFNTELEEIKSIGSDKADIYVCLERVKDKKRFIIELEVFVYNSSPIVGSAYLHYDCSWEETTELKNTLFGEFINHFDTRKNVIIYTDMGLKVRPRITPKYSVHQFDVQKFIKEIRSVFAKKKKRGYAWIGPPGTGKSSILIEIEDEVRDFPVVYISTNAMRYKSDVKGMFSFARSIAPCMCNFEDLDSYGLHSKNEALGEFLEQIDSTKGVSNIIFNATLNDTSGVHYSLINRPGRFDEVFLIDVPDDIGLARQTIDNKMKQEGKEVEGKIADKTLQRMIDNKFSYADICEVIEKLIINDDVLTNQSIDQSVTHVLNTKRSIQKCNFHNQDPNEMPDDDDECYEIAEENEGSLGRGGLRRSNTVIPPRGPVARPGRVTGAYARPRPKKI